MNSAVFLLDQLLLRLQSFHSNTIAIDYQQMIMEYKEQITSDVFSVDICVDCIQSILIAIESGATRLELCSSLIEGGITPSFGLIDQSLLAIKNYFSNNTSNINSNLNMNIIQLHVIIRPRAGDFLYNEQEYNIIKSNILMCIHFKQLYPEIFGGIVCGFLTADGLIDEQKLAETVKLVHTHNLPFTFHRAIDMCDEAKLFSHVLPSLYKCKIDRILTSGLRSKCGLGLLNISKIIRFCEQQNCHSMIVAVGGGLKNISTVLNIIQECKNEYGINICHVHGTFRGSMVDSHMEYRNRENIFMGGRKLNENNVDEEYCFKFADSSVIKEIVLLLKNN